MGHFYMEDMMADKKAQAKAKRRLKVSLEKLHEIRVIVKDEEYQLVPHRLYGYAGAYILRPVPK